MKVGLLGDLHIGSPQSKWRDAALVINKIMPELDALILIGDTTEELNPYLNTQAFAKHDNALLKRRIQSAFAQFEAKISEYLNNIVYLRGNHDDQIINQCSIVEPYAILHSKFGRIVVLHGHQTNFTRYGLKLGWGIQSARKLKNNLHLEQYCGIQLEYSDFLIIGHCHVVFKDVHMKICSPGCWVGQYSNRNTGWFIIIDDENVESPSEFIQLKRNPSLYSRTTCECGFNKLPSDALFCPVCQKDLLPRCKKSGCERPLRGEETRICKIHSHNIRYYE